MSEFRVLPPAPIYPIPQDKPKEPPVPNNPTEQKPEDPGSVGTIDPDPNKGQHLDRYA